MPCAELQTHVRMPKPRTSTRLAMQRDVHVLQAASALANGMVLSHAHTASIMGSSLRSSGRQKSYHDSGAPKGYVAGTGVEHRYLTAWSLMKSIPFRSLVNAMVTWSIRRSYRIPTGFRVTTAIRRIFGGAGIGTSQPIPRGQRDTCA